MKKTILAAAVLLASGCAHQKLHSGEPLDPTGADARAAAKQPDDQFPKMLQATVLHFNYDEATLSTADQHKLATLASEMRTRPWASIRIAGHCDERGTEEYNLALGQRRADAARAYLIAMGVPTDSVETVSFGAEVPAVEGSDDEAYALNRRAEFGPMPLELFGALSQAQ